MQPGKFKALVEKVYGDWDMPVPIIEQTHIGSNTKKTVATLFDENKITVKVTNVSGETKVEVKGSSSFYDRDHEWSAQELIRLADALDMSREILGKIEEKRR